MYNVVPKGTYKQKKIAPSILVSLVFSGFVLFSMTYLVLELMIYIVWL